MGNGAFNNTSAVAPAPSTVVQTHVVPVLDIPYGFVYFYPGAATSNGRYTCPIMSVHTYRFSTQRTDIAYATTQPSHGQVNVNTRTAERGEHLTSDESVIMIPIQDVISICYTTGVKKSFKATQHVHAVPIVGSNGFCSCDCSDGTPKSREEIRMTEQMGAERVITVYLEYSQHSHVDTLSGARILSDADRAQFYKAKFQPETRIAFYLVRNAEYDSTSFEAKKAQAEDLCRVVSQLKGISSDVLSRSSRTDAEPRTVSYPSPEELRGILNQPPGGLFGDTPNEGSNSLRATTDYGARAPVSTFPPVYK